MEKEPKPTDELMEAVIDSVLQGDEEGFSTFNDALSDAMGDGIPIGRRGKKVKMRFGGGHGAIARKVITDAVCPQCGQELHSEGISFEPSVEEREKMDEREAKAWRALEERDPAEDLIYLHQVMGGCPAYVWRRKVKDVFEFKIGKHQPIRGFFHFGMGFAWRNLNYNHWFEGRIYRALRWKMDLGWRMLWVIQDFVGIFEQRRWDHR